MSYMQQRDNMSNHQDMTAVSHSSHTMSIPYHATQAHVYNGNNGGNNNVAPHQQMQQNSSQPDLEVSKSSPPALEFDGTTVLCQVCGDKASGFHYGVHSCEGCKGFFRRSIQQKIQYKPCAKNQQCSILRINRNRCQYCRLKKCIAVGMSRDAVRFGRVPKREKARIMAEMQRVSQVSQANELSVQIDDERKLTHTIIQAHAETCEYTRERAASILQQAKWNPNMYAHCPSQMACPLNPNPSGSKHLESSQMLDEFSNRFTPAIRGVVEFAKRIPGFNILCQDDQVTLLKAGVFEVLLVRLACMFDSQTNTMLFINGQIYKRETLQQKGNSAFLINSMFEFAERLNALQLTSSEIGLFSAIVLIAPDRPGIRNSELVVKLQDKCIQGLQTAMKNNHPDGPSLFARLIMKVPDLRTLSTLHSEKLLALKMEPSSEPPTRAEIRSNTDRLFSTLAMGGLNQVNAAMNTARQNHATPWQLPPVNNYQPKTSNGMTTNANNSTIVRPNPTLPPIRQLWDQPSNIPNGGAHTNGLNNVHQQEDSLSPNSQTSENSMVSPSSTGTIKEFEMLRSKREHDNTDVSSEGRSPKRDESDMSDTSEKEAMDATSTECGQQSEMPPDSDKQLLPRNPKGFVAYNHKKFVNDRSTSEAATLTTNQTSSRPQVGFLPIKPEPIHGSPQISMSQSVRNNNEYQHLLGRHLSQEEEWSIIAHQDVGTDQVNKMTSAVNCLPPSSTSTSSASLPNFVTLATQLPGMAPPMQEASPIGTSFNTNNPHKSEASNFGSPAYGNYHQMQAAQASYPVSYSPSSQTKPVSNIKCEPLNLSVKTELSHLQPNITYHIPLNVAHALS